MPLVNVFLKEGKSQDYLQSVRLAIHNALMTAWGIPEHDCFQIIHEKKIEHLYIDPSMWNMKRTDNVIVLQIVSTPRTKDMKLAFYQLLSNNLQNVVQLKPDNLFISIVNNQPEDWSFGYGKAQLEVQQG